MGPVVHNSVVFLKLVGCFVFEFIRDRVCPTLIFISPVERKAYFLASLPAACLITSASTALWRVPDEIG